MSHTPRLVPTTSDTAIRKLSSAIIWTWAAVVILITASLFVSFSGPAFGLITILGGPVTLTAGIKTGRALTYMRNRGLPRA